MIPVNVQWIDTLSEGGWVESPEKVKPVIVNTMGWLLDNNEDYVLVAGSYTTDEGYGDVSAIPQCCVQVMFQWEKGPVVNTTV